MKKVGIIGGAGPLASALFYKSLVLECYRFKQAIPEIHLINTPFTRGLTIQDGQKNKEVLTLELECSLNQLMKADVDIAVLACNTLHLYLHTQKIPFVSIPESVMEEAKRNNHHRLLILGTENTCDSPLYQSHKIEKVCPLKKDQLILNQILNRILKGKILKKDSCFLETLIQKLSKTDRFDGVVLGCTELPVLYERFPFYSKKPLYDSIKIPAKTLRGLL